MNVTAPKEGVTEPRIELKPSHENGLFVAFINSSRAFGRTALLTEISTEDVEAINNGSTETLGKYLLLGVTCFEDGSRQPAYYAQDCGVTIGRESSPIGDRCIFLEYQITPPTTQIFRSYQVGFLDTL